MNFSCVRTCRVFAQTVTNTLTIDYFDSALNLKYVSFGDF